MDVLLAEQQLGLLLEQPGGSCEDWCMASALDFGSGLHADASEPLPIGARAPTPQRQETYVDSMDSSQTLLGQSYDEVAAYGLGRYGGGGGTDSLPARFVPLHQDLASTLHLHEHSVHSLPTAAPLLRAAASNSSHSGGVGLRELLPPWYEEEERQHGGQYNPRQPLGSYHNTTSALGAFQPQTHSHHPPSEALLVPQGSTAALGCPSRTLHPRFDPYLGAASNACSAPPAFSLAAAADEDCCDLAPRPPSHYLSAFAAAAANLKRRVAGSGYTVQRYGGPLLGEGLAQASSVSRGADEEEEDEMVDGTAPFGARYTHSAPIPVQARRLGLSTGHSSSWCDDGPLCDAAAFVMGGAMGVAHASCPPLPTLLEDFVDSQGARQLTQGSDNDSFGPRSSSQSPSVGPLRRVSSAKRILAAAATSGARPTARATAPSRLASRGGRVQRPSSWGSSGRLAAAAAAEAEEIARPARAAARRSLALAAAAAAAEEDPVYDSASEDGDEEDEGSLGDERVHGGFLGYATSAGLGGNKKKHNPWSLQETEALVEGVRICGVGKWAEVKKLPISVLTGCLLHRTPVDLKDKWRNLTRVARLPKATLKARMQKSGTDVPLELMLQVKDLMDLARD